MKMPHYPGVDGIKGLAILAVFVTHIPLSIWHTFIPQFLRPLISIVLSSGGVGVTLFFLTSGFLMGYLYPAPRSPIRFYARRYRRLFPAFLVMVASFTIIKLIRIPVLTHVVVVFACILVMRWLLRLLGKLKLRFSLRNKLIYVALIFQVLVALWYIFYLQKIPAAVFYINWSPVAQTLVSAVINATLTLPFGNYIGQLDGIYWALGAEVLFYLLYPVVVAPIIHRSKNASRLHKVFLYLALFPFCYGLYYIGQRLLGFEMLHLHLILYFITGVVIGQNLEVITHKLRRFQSILTHPAVLVYLILVLLSSVFLTGYLSVYFETWLTLLMVLPAGLLLISALMAHDTLLSKRWLMTLGNLSYPIFLTHSLVIHVVQRYIPVNFEIGALRMVILSFLGSLLLAYILRRLIERTYFSSRKQAGYQSVVIPVPDEVSKWRIKGFVIFLLAVTYISYKPPLAFFTTVIRHTGAVVNNQEITLSNQPYRQTLTAQENNLGMLTTHIKKTHIPGVEGGFVPFLLYIRLRDEHEQVIAESTYQAYQILDDPYLAFGFPLISDSKNKKYTVEYQLSETSPSEELKLVTNEANLLSVYFVNKHLLLRRPGLFIFWLFHKAIEPLTNLCYWITMVYIGPFIGLLFLSKRAKVSLPQQEAVE